AVGCAGMGGVWMGWSGGWIAVALPVLAVLAVAPAVWRIAYRDFPERWPFFTEGLYKTCIPRNENVAIFPFGFWGSSMLWQAESGFWFRMAEGYAAPDPPAKSLRDPTIRELTFTAENPTMAQILGMAKRKHVGRILSVDIYVHPDGHQMHRFGEVQDLGGVLVSPACGHTPLGPRSRLLPAR